MKNEMSSSLGRNGNKNVGQAMPDKGSTAWENETRLITRQAEPDLRFIAPKSTVYKNHMSENSPKNQKAVQGRVARPASTGFTLIELLVVVLIIGILAAVALPQYKVAVAKSHLATIRPILATIKQAEEAYYMANGEYTYDWDMLGVDLSACISPRSGEDIRQCGNYFIVDPLKDETPVVYAVYCPSYIQTTAMTSRWATGCRNNGDFTYTVWFTHSDNPDKIECTGSTDLGRKVCGSLNL